MGIKVNCKELEAVLDITPSQQNVMLVGRHGVGKSEILTKHYANKGIPVIALFLGQMSDPGDLIGLPQRDTLQERTTFLPPWWFPIEEKPVVLFLDELNRARPEVLQTIMDLTLNRTIAGHRLPNGSRIIAAVNDGEEYQLTDLDPALVSRFNVYEFNPSVEEWLLLATKNGIDSRIIAFIQENPAMLDESGDTKLDQGLGKSPDRRGWEKVSNIIKDKKELPAIYKKTIGGIVGVQAAAAFFKSFSNNRVINASDILLNYNKYKVAIRGYRLHEIAILNESICRFFESEKGNDIDATKVAGNLTDYLNAFVNEEKKESFAHFVSLYESGNYPKMMLFILRNAPAAYATIKNFVATL
jgi:hypothetical protein